MKFDKELSNLLVYIYPQKRTDCLMQEQCL